MPRATWRRGQVVCGMTLLSLLSAGRSPASSELLRDLAVSPDGAHVYAARGTPANALIAYRRTKSGDLSVLQTLPPSACTPILPGPPPLSAVAGSHDGRYVYATTEPTRRAPATGAVLTLARVADTTQPDFGKLTLQQVLEKGSQATTPMQGLVGTSAIAVSPDDRHIYVAATIELETGPTPSGAVLSFEREASGDLRYLGEIHGDLDGDGAADLGSTGRLAISPDGASIYVVASEVDGLVHLHRDPATGALTFAQVLRADATQGALTTPSEVTLSADGRFVYVAARSGHLSWYGRRVKDGRGVDLDPAHADFGALTYLGRRRPSFAGASGLGLGSIALGLDARQSFAYAAATTSGSGGVILMYGRDATTGALSLSPLQALDDGGVSANLTFAPALPGKGSGQVFGIARRLFRLNAYQVHRTSGELRWNTPAYGEPTAAPYCTVSPTATPSTTPTETQPPAPQPTRTPTPSAHDSAVVAHPAITVAFGGAATREQRAFVSVRNMDGWETPPHSIQLTVEDGTCPPGTIVGTPIFPPSGSATIAVKGGGKSFARLDLRLQRTDFKEFPTSCELRLRATTVGPHGAFDPVTANDSATLLLEIDP